MCSVRAWNNLSITYGKSCIFATRSDGVIIRLDLADFEGSLSTFVEVLESYRNCNCSQLAPCDKHKYKGENEENARNTKNN